MLGLARLLSGLAGERDWGGESGIGLELFELGTEEGVLLVEVVFQSLDMC